MNAKTFFRIVVLSYLAVFIVMPLADIHIESHDEKILHLTRSPNSSKLNILNVLHEILFAHCGKRVEHTSDSRSPSSKFGSKLNSFRFNSIAKFSAQIDHNTSLSLHVPVNSLVEYSAVQISGMEAFRGYHYFFAGLSPPPSFS